MSVIDILTRVDAICQKYDKYDVEKRRELQEISAGSDAFTRLYRVVEADLQALQEKADQAASEKNRAVVVAINSEIRRSKAKLREEITKLQRLSHKKVKGLSNEELAARGDLVLALADRIESVPDGMGPVVKQPNWRSTTQMEIKIDASSSGVVSQEEFYEHSEQSKQFRQEYELRKARQDQGLDVISEGLGTLKNLAEDINEEMDRQVPLVDEIDSKVDTATSNLKSTNVRLKETVLKMRSSRNFCIDIILLCIILGIAAYLYNWQNRNPQTTSYKHSREEMRPREDEVRHDDNYMDEGGMSVNSDDIEEDDYDPDKLMMMMMMMVMAEVTMDQRRWWCYWGWWH